MKIAFPILLTTLLGGSSLETQAATPKPAVTSAEPTAFQSVAAKLDAGGGLYLYFSTDQWLGRLSTKVNQVRDFVLGLPALEGEERETAVRAFKLLDGLVRHSGIESVAGVGMSGIAVEKGFYRTRFVLQRTAGDAGGYFWQWFGSQSHPLAAQEWLPADTVWATFGDLDLQAIWTALEREAAAAELAPFIEGLKELSANIEAATGRSLSDHFASLGGEVGVALLLDPTRTIQVPLPAGPLELPEPSLVIALKVKNDQLFDWVDKALAQNPDSKRAEADGARWRSLAIPAPVPFPLEPTVGRAGDYLWFASTPAAFERVRKTRAGTIPGLRTTEEFKRLARDLPTEGNSFQFTSARFSATLMQIQQTILDQAAAESGGVMPPTSFFQNLMGLTSQPMGYAVGWSDPTGMQSVSQGNQEPATVLVSSAVVAPVAIMAGMTLPALAKAKDRAQEINCINNLKQLALGMLIYATDHDDQLPKSLADIKDEVSHPGPFFCPQDPQRPDTRSLSLKDLDTTRSTYEFLTPGGSTTDLDPSTVMLRCKIHGHEAHVDGSVNRR